MAKCLVVDDVEVTRFTTKEILAELQVDSVMANDPGEALKVLKGGGIDVILLDWHLGKESGLDLLQTIRSEYGSLPVIVFSGVEGEEKSKEAIDAGANSFLVKPTTKEKVEGALSKVGISFTASGA